MGEEGALNGKGRKLGPDDRINYENATTGVLFWPVPLCHVIVVRKE